MTRTLLVLTCAVCAGRLTSNAAAPSIDVAFKRYWDAGNPGEAWKAAQDVIRSGISFEDATVRLKRGRTYSARPSHKVVDLMRRAALGDFNYSVYLPDSYDPQRAYQLRLRRASRRRSRR